ncbi:MAG: DUF4367 domain-containing protein [Eubacterium sp.]|nr:DUF4367 domain-containing protein [Eubacterium sp.]
MTSEELIYFLKSEPMKFTYSEIEQMMDEEMAKDPDEMDTDFVDLCADVLCKALDEIEQKETDSNGKNNKRIKFKLLRIVVAAIVFALMLCTAVSVAAKYVHNETSDKIVKFYEDHFSINLRNGETCSEKYSDESIELISKLKDNGFDNIILPSALLTDDYTYNVDIDENDELLTAYCTYNSKNTVVHITITKHKNDENSILTNDTQVTAQYDSAKQLSLNGMDIIVLGGKEVSTITYVDNDTIYAIELGNNDFDSAVEIAKSIN